MRLTDPDEIDYVVERVYEQLHNRRYTKKDVVFGEGYIQIEHKYNSLESKNIIREHLLAGHDVKAGRTVTKVKGVYNKYIFIMKKV